MNEFAIGAHVDGAMHALKNDDLDLTEGIEMSVAATINNSASTSECAS